MILELNHAGNGRKQERVLVQQLGRMISLF